MTIVEERLKALVEIVANQKAKINDLDRKVGDLERALRDELAANKVLMKLLEGQLSPEAIKRLKAMLSCMARVRKEDPKYFEGFVKRLEDNPND